MSYDSDYPKKIELTKLKDIEVLRLLESILRDYPSIDSNGYKEFIVKIDPLCTIRDRAYLNEKLKALIGRWLEVLAVKTGRLLAWLDAWILELDFQSEIQPYFLNLSDLEKQKVLRELSLESSESIELLALYHKANDALKLVILLDTYPLVDQSKEFNWAKDPILGEVYAIQGLAQRLDLIAYSNYAPSVQDLLVNRTTNLAKEEFRLLADKLGATMEDFRDFVRKLLFNLIASIAENPDFNDGRLETSSNPDLNLLEDKIDMLLPILVEEHDILQEAAFNLDVSRGVNAFTSEYFLRQLQQYVLELPKDEAPILEDFSENTPVEDDFHQDDDWESSNQSFTDDSSLHEELEEEAVPKEEEYFLVVDYELDLKERVNSYPVLIIPESGCVVRSFKHGKTKIRGYCEERFEARLVNLFSEYYEVIGDARLNVPNQARPYEPDIALVSKSNPSLRIDVEIDEPYAGISRVPTHCKGDDEQRNVFFRDRGWIVIRFSEKQVFEQEKACAAFIARVLASADSDFQIPVALLDLKGPVEEEFWDQVQAEKWESINFREDYLGHEFGLVHIEAEESNRELSEQEILEENKVVPSYFKTTPEEDVEHVRPKSRDERIQFFPDSHSYYIDGIPYSSATQIISRFFPTFDKVYWANRKAPVLQMSARAVMEMWDEKGRKAAQQGSKLHEQIQQYFLDGSPIAMAEGAHFASFLNHNPTINPDKVEWRIFNEKYRVAGTVDLLSKESDEFYMYDWKRSSKIALDNGLPIIGNPYHKYGFGPLENVDDTKFNQDALQQNLYRYILESNYGIQIAGMFIVVLHSKYNTFHKIPVPDMREELMAMLEALNE
jgi:hypothetical protein